MAQDRPSPETFLKRAEYEESELKHVRGKLKIYLGAAPGVGKTYEMLHDAIAEKAKGSDLVIGIVESHGRKETRALFEGFEILPLQEIDYRGKELLEFDLESAIKRKPILF